MIIMGVDPGLKVTGYGVISFQDNTLRGLHYGGIRTDPDLPMQRRLKGIYDALSDLIREYRPDALVVEELFFNRNVNTAFAVGMARGVTLLAAEMEGVPVSSYTPLQVKRAVVGYGRATKGQIQQMVKVLLGLGEVPTPDDAADALALAICHANSYRLSQMITSDPLP
ncbi:TPA: crossover junction endodeoxyribonuclease RuvC [Candidatus Poribacteria bacterium]|nr:crossover junction endodeoxyribonuclease RuvC [Candidatus Poribacteria bacterium]